jgi:hypothetical protein
MPKSPRASRGGISAALRQAGNCIVYNEFMKHKIYLPLVVLVLATLACAVPFVGEKPTPTPALQEHQAGFTAVYTSYLKPNDYLPGATCNTSANREPGEPD